MVVSGRTRPGEGHFHGEAASAALPMGGRTTLELQVWDAADRMGGLATICSHFKDLRTLVLGCALPLPAGLRGCIDQRRYDARPVPSGLCCLTSLRSPRSLAVVFQRFRCGSTAHEPRARCFACMLRLPPLSPDDVSCCRGTDVLELSALTVLQLLVLSEVQFTGRRSTSEGGVQQLESVVSALQGLTKLSIRRCWVEKEQWEADCDQVSTLSDRCRGLHRVLGWRFPPEVHAGMPLLRALDMEAVSYTHLTLPTILLV